MKILVILGHPDPDSLNHAIASVVCDSLRKNGHSVLFHDLYAESFDPLLPKEEMPDIGLVPDIIENYCKELQSADGIVIIHPNWWGQPPAILKGWIDRVFRPGIAYRFQEGDSGEGIPIGLLKATAAVVFNTSNTPNERERSAFGDPLEAMWKRCVFGLCGVPVFHRRTFNVVITSSFDQRREWLNEARELAARAFSERDTQHRPSADAASPRS
jgi:putative NADPH-quinone reductase